MNFTKIIESLLKLGIAAKFDDKRILTPKIGINLRIKLYRAAIATRKPVSSVIITALETYVMRNDDKHREEIESIATLRGMAPEDVIVEEIRKKFKDGIKEEDEE